MGAKPVEKADDNLSLLKVKRLAFDILFNIVIKTYFLETSGYIAGRSLSAS